MSLKGPSLKILIINPFGIGDVLFTTPLISNIKYHDPQGFIGYLGNRRTAEFLDGYPKIDKVFVYERDEYHRLYKDSKRDFFIKFFQALAEIRRERFDVVLDLSLNGYAGFLMWLAGIKRRVGFHYKNRSLFLTTRIPLKGYEDRHVVEYYLSLLKELGMEIQMTRLEFPIKPEDSQWVDQLLHREGIGPQDVVIGLVPGGGASWGKDAVYKQWAPQKYAKLADKMIEKFPAKIILLGDQNDSDLCRRIQGLIKGFCVDCSGRTTLGQFAALLKRCLLNVVNDGGPLHVAVAAGAKTVSIFGPVDETVYGPYPPADTNQVHTVVKKNLACRPCYRRFRRAECDHISCLHSIAVEDVLEKVGEIL